MELSKAQQNVVHELKQGKSLINIVTKRGDNCRVILQESNAPFTPVRFIIFRKLKKYGIVKLKNRVENFEYYELSE